MGLRGCNCAILREEGRERGQMVGGPGAKKQSRRHRRLVSGLKTYETCPAGFHTCLGPGPPFVNPHLSPVKWECPSCAWPTKGLQKRRVRFPVTGSLERGIPSRHGTYSVPRVLEVDHPHDATWNLRSRRYSEEMLESEQMLEQAEARRGWDGENLFRTWEGDTFTRDGGGRTVLG